MLAALCAVSLLAGLQALVQTGKFGEDALRLAHRKFEVRAPMRKRQQ